MAHQSTKESAFETCFYDTKDKLYGFIKSLIRDDEQAKDLLQQCYLRLWETFDRVDTTQTILPLLFTISRHLVTDHLRKERRLQLMADLSDLSVEPADTHSTEDYLHEKTYQQQLMTLLKKMPERRRQVFVMIRMQGYNYKRTAELLNISVSTVEKHMNEAHKFFSEELAISLSVLLLIASVC